MSQPTDDVVLLRIEQAARRMSIGVRTLQTMLRNNEIAHVRRGRLVRLRPEAIDAWIAEQESAHGPNTFTKNRGYR